MPDRHDKRFGVFFAQYTQKSVFFASYSAFKLEKQAKWWFIIQIT